MPKQDAGLFRLPVGYLKPRHITFRLVYEPRLGLKLKLALGSTKTHAGQVIGNHTPTHRTTQVNRPLGRGISIHIVVVDMRQIVIADNILNFVSEFARLVNGPLGGDAGMDDSNIAVFIVVQ